VKKPVSDWVREEGEGVSDIGEEDTMKQKKKLK
jgi:hypothetical protein